MEETPLNPVKKRISDVIEPRGLKAKLAKMLGFERASISDMLKTPGDPPVHYVKAVSELTGRRVEWLLTGEGPELVDNAVPYAPEPINDEYLSGKNIRPITVTVDRTGKELMTYVPVRAQAGYRRGFGDPHYIEKLPAFSLPINVSGTHRMFQVDGNSMRQLGGGGLNDGDIVIAQYVEDIFSMKDGRVYVIITNEGVIVKRCINRLLTPDRVLVANSDNKSGEYPPIILHPNEILEVWELKAFISKQLSLATDLWDIINDMQVKMALMEDKLKGIEQTRLQ